MTSEPLADLSVHALAAGSEGRRRLVLRFGRIGLALAAGIGAALAHPPFCPVCSAIRC
jgi:thiamine pyrophosphate-dependent acetolactate synthase large subunit-like protein